MSLHVMTRSSCQSLFQASEETLVDRTGRGLRTILLVPSMGVAARRKEMLAETGLIGVAVDTIPNHVSALWNLLGDGRAIVESARREAIVDTIVTAHNAAASSDEHLGTSAGAIRLFSDVFARGAGLPAFETAVALCGEGFSLSPRERAILSIAGDLARSLAAGGLIEFGEAAASMSRETYSSSAYVFEGFSRFSPQEIAFVNALARENDVTVVMEWTEGDPRLEGADSTVKYLRLMCEECAAAGIESRFLPEDPDSLDADIGELASLRSCLFAPSDPIRPTGAVRFATAAGVHAETVLIVDEVSKCIDAGFDPSGIAIVVRDSICHLPGLSDEFALRGIPCKAEYCVKLPISALGSALLSLLSALADEKAPVATAVDFALSPFSWTNRREVWPLDAAWRNNRELSASDCLRDMARTSSAIADIIAAAMDVLSMKKDIVWANRFADLLRFMLASAQASGRCAALGRIENERAASSVLSFVEDVLDVPGMLRVDMLKEVSVSVPFETHSGTRGLEDDGTGGATYHGPVTITTMKRLGIDRYPVVILCDLTAADYPMNHDVPLVDRLFEKLGIRITSSYMQEQRWDFFHAVSAAEKMVIFERRLNDASGDEERASALWDEVIDCYRPRGSAPSADTLGGRAPERITGIPGFPPAYATSLSESALSESLPAFDRKRRALRHEFAHGAKSTAASIRGHLSPESVKILAAIDEFSVTELEAYLECPYRWFYDRQLDTRELGTGFGPLEKGSFSHRVLELFFRDFCLDADGVSIRRVTKGNLQDAHKTLDATIAFVKDEHELVPINTVELIELRTLETQLHRTLDREVDFLPEFHPAYLEFKVGRSEGRPVKYAGVWVRGKIDRIDMGPCKRAAIIDYKSSKVTMYGLKDKRKGPDDLFGGSVKIQAAVYARVAERLLDLTPVASLYRSIAGNEVRGAWSGDHLEFEALGAGFKKYDAIPGKDEDITYAGYLDEIERRVAAAVDRLHSGDIEARPASKDACTFCKAKNVCPKESR